MNYLKLAIKTMGYADPRYADSMREFGEPRELPRCGGWVLVRSIPGTTYKDATGCYPLFACLNWKKLNEDIEHLGSELVSLVLVSDPFSAFVPSYMEHCFDFVKPFKKHYVADLGHPLESVINQHHRKRSRKLLDKMEVEVCQKPSKYLDEWIQLYDNLIRRHNIKDNRIFSRKCFKTQLEIPGMVMVLCRCEGEIVGAALVLINGEYAYGHLSACSNKGYQIGASYGIKWTTLAYLRDQGIRYFDMGGAAGFKDDSHNGLAKFKRGWSNDQRTVYLCGRVFDRGKYESLCQRGETHNNDYFPAYRVIKNTHLK